MYSRGYTYNRPPYPVTPHDSHGPPPLSHPPYVYSPPTRYTCSTYPSASSYPVPNSSPSYSHIPQPLTHYGDPRFMEMGPREEAPILHHLPQPPSVMDHPEHSRQSMDGSSQLLPSCEQGNETIRCFYWCLLKISPLLSVITTLEAFNTLSGMHLKWLWEFISFASTVITDEQLLESASVNDQTFENLLLPSVAMLSLYATWSSAFVTISILVYEHKAKLLKAMVKN